MGNRKFLVIKSGNYGIIGECQRPPRTALKLIDALAHKETGFFYPDLGFKLTSCTFLKNRQDACSTKSEFSCGVGILPAHKRLIENGAISQFKPSILVEKPGFSASVRKS